MTASPCGLHRVAWAPVEAVEQLGGRDLQGDAQLGHRPYARLTLATLDLGDVRHVEARRQRETLLAEAAFLADATEVRSEGVERVRYRCTITGQCQSGQIRLGQAAVKASLPPRRPVT